MKKKKKKTDTEALEHTDVKLILKIESISQEKKRKVKKLSQKIVFFSFHTHVSSQSERFSLLPCL